MVNFNILFKLLEPNVLYLSISRNLLCIYLVLRYRLTCVLRQGSGHWEHGDAQTRIYTCILNDIQQQRRLHSFHEPSKPSPIFCYFFSSNREDRASWFPGCSCQTMPMICNIYRFYICAIGLYYENNTWDLLYVIFRWVMCFSSCLFSCINKLCKSEYLNLH